VTSVGTGRGKDDARKVWDGRKRPCPRTMGEQGRYHGAGIRYVCEPVMFTGMMDARARRQRDGCASPEIVAL